MPTLHAPSGSPRISPLILSDRLLTLAQDADRAGLRSAAHQLLELAHVVCEPTQHTKQ